MPTRPPPRDVLPASSAALAIVAFGLVVLATPYPAASQGLEGTWTAGPTRIRVSVESWGPDCGTRPRSSTRRGEGQVSVERRGDQLAFGPPVNERTDTCWSENRALRRVSTTHRGDTWVTRCRTPADDSRAESGTYSLRTRAPSRIERTSESRYDWALNDSRCVATVTEAQTFERVRRPDDPRAAAGTPACTPGAAQRIRLRPEARAIAPGERLCLRATVLDASGCPLTDARVDWRLERPRGVTGQLRGRCFEAGANAATAEGVFRVVASANGLEARASVTVRTADLSDLRAKRIAHGGDGTPGGDARAEDAARVAARAGSDGLRSWLFWVVVGAGLALVVLAAASAVIVARRRAAAPNRVSAPAPAGTTVRAPPPAMTEPAPPPVMTEAPPSGMAGPGRPATERSDAKICPVCRRGYPESARFCAHDSAALVPYAAFRGGEAQPAEAAPQARCPQCGTVYPSATRFCGKDGQALVELK